MTQHKFEIVTDGTRDDNHLRVDGMDLYPTTLTVDLDATTGTGRVDMSFLSSDIRSALDLQIKRDRRIARLTAELEKMTRRADEADSLLEYANHLEAENAMLRRNLYKSSLYAQGYSDSVVEKVMKEYDAEEEMV